MRGDFKSLFDTVTSTTPRIVALSPLTDATARFTILPDDVACAVVSADANDGLLVRRSKSDRNWPLDIDRTVARCAGNVVASYVVSATTKRLERARTSVRSRSGACVRNKKTDSAKKPTINTA